MASDYPLLATTLLRHYIPIVRITAIHTQQRAGVGQERDGHNLKQERFRLDTNKNFFTLRAAKQWSRLSNLVQPQSQPCFEQGVGPETF